LQIKILIQISLLIFLFGCDANPKNFKFEAGLLKGIEKGRELNKPIFICFTGYACIGYDEFKYDFITSKQIQKKLNEDFVSVLLHVDDKKLIDKKDTINLEKELFRNHSAERIRKSKNIGNINAAIEIELFHQNSQPLYVILNPEKEVLIEPFGYSRRDRKLFLTKLEEGLDKFKKQEIKEIESDSIKITLEYYGMMCDCPQWIRPEDKSKYHKSIESGSSMSEDSVFIRREPANELVLNPFELTDENTKNYIFEFEGQFYKGKHKWVSEDGIEYNTKLFKYVECKLKK